MGQVRNTTFRLDEDLLQAARVYAAQSKTSVNAMVRDHLQKVTGFSQNTDQSDAVALYSHGDIGKSEAMRRLGIHNYGELLDLLQDRGMPIPRLPDAETERMADKLACILQKSAK